MHPRTKKVVMMTAISLGVIMFGYMMPVFVVKVALGVSEAASCTDHDYVNAMLSKSSGFSAEGDSSDLMGSWTRGMEGMMCMIGLDMGSSSNAFTGQITLNKVLLPKVGMSTAAAGSKTPKQHRCNLCGRVFDSAELLESHKKMEHGKNSSPPAGVG